MGDEAPGHRLGRVLAPHTVNHPHPLVRGVEGTVGRVAGHYIWNRTRRIVSYNPMVDAHLSAHGVPADRIIRSSIGVDTGRYAPGPVDRDAVLTSFHLPSGVPLVLFVGRLVDKKGYRHLLRATGPGYHIAMVGSGEPAEPLPQGVTFLGPLPRERVHRNQIMEPGVRQLMTHYFRP
jgi:glycosyltransferase involved in cell wall biosynthesis